MCSYHYKYKKHQLTDVTCIYPQFYAEYASHFPETQKLPVDPEGLCLFHSRNKEWKIDNGFGNRFNELLKATAIICQINPVRKWAFNFSGFYFLPETGALNSENCPTNIALDFRFCEFEDDFIIKDLHLKSIDLDNSNIQGTFSIRNVNLSSNINASNCIYINGILIWNAVLEGYNYFDGCTFKQLNKKSSTEFKFKESTIAYINFENSIFESAVTFEKLALNNDVIFDKCTFSDECYLHDCEINAVCSFKETSFLLPENANPMYSSVDLRKLRLSENGKLIFTGSKPFENMVSGELEINFAANPKGFVLFENFNLNKITAHAKLKLFELEKTGKVEIGKGCRKYYCQTPVFEIRAAKANQVLILDLVKVFTNYFEIHNHYNLGVEIIERKSDLLRYFFFSDEIISNDEFETRIKNNEIDLWQSFSNLSQYAADQLTVSLVKEKDLLVDVAGVFLKIKNRILAGDFSPKQWSEIVGSIAIDGRPVINTDQSFNTITNAFRSFFIEYPIFNINQLTMNNTTNIGSIGNAQIGDGNTQNIHEIIDTQFKGVFENCIIENDKKTAVVEQVKEMKKETDPEKRKTCLKNLHKIGCQLLAKLLSGLLRR